MKANGAVELANLHANAALERDIARARAAAGSNYLFLCVCDFLIVLKN